MVFQMYGFGLAFLAVAVVAALFGFGAISDDFPLMGKMCAAFFLLAAAAAFGWARLNRAGTSTEPARRWPGGPRAPSAGDGIRRHEPNWGQS